MMRGRTVKFMDATKQVNLILEEHTTGVAVADFDNNGLQDLIIIRRGDLIHENESIIYLNNGASGFIPLKNHHI